MMLTEVSCKFRREGVAREPAAAGLRQTHCGPTMPMISGRRLR